MAMNAAEEWSDGLGDYEETEQIPEALVDDILRGNVVAFVGAGFSAAAGTPTWPTLLKALLKESLNRSAVDGHTANELERMISKGTADAFDRVAQVLEDALGDDLFDHILREQLTPHGPLNQTMLTRLRLLSQIPFRAILTTNINALLPGPTPFNVAQRPFRDVLRPPRGLDPGELGSAQFFSLHEEDDDATAGEEDTTDRHGASCATEGRARASSGGPFSTSATKLPRFRVPVVQLHGSVLEPHSPVLTRTGYRRLLHQVPGYQDFLLAVMSRYTVLYIGFSFTDSYLNELRSKVLAMLDGGIRPGPAFAPGASAAHAGLAGSSDESTAFGPGPQPVQGSATSAIDSQNPVLQQPMCSTPLRTSHVEGSDAGTSFSKDATGIGGGTFMERTATALHASRRAPIAYAIIDRMSRLERNYLATHEGVHVLTWDSDPGRTLAEQVQACASQRDPAQAPVSAQTQARSHMQADGAINSGISRQKSTRDATEQLISPSAAGSVGMGDFAPTSEADQVQLSTSASTSQTDAVLSPPRAAVSSLGGILTGRPGQPLQPIQAHSRDFGGLERYLTRIYARTSYVHRVGFLLAGRHILAQDPLLRTSKEDESVTALIKLMVEAVRRYQEYQGASATGGPMSSPKPFAPGGGQGLDQTRRNSAGTSGLGLGLAPSGGPSQPPFFGPGRVWGKPSAGGMAESPQHHAAGTEDVRPHDADRQPDPTVTPVTRGLRAPHGHHGHGAAGHVAAGGVPGSSYDASRGTVIDLVKTDEEAFELLAKAKRGEGPRYDVYIMPYGHRERDEAAGVPAGCFKRMQRMRELPVACWAPVLVFGQQEFAAVNRVAVQRWGAFDLAATYHGLIRVLERLFRGTADNFVPYF